MSQHTVDQYALVQKLSFIRYGGTEDELRAANIIRSEIEACGGESSLMDFEIPAYEVSHCRMAVTAPYVAEIPCVPFGRSGNLDAELKLKYVEVNSEAGFLGMEDLSGCAVLINGLEQELYGELVRRRASAVIVIARGKWYQTPADTDLVERALRDPMLALGQIPSFLIRPSEAMKLISLGAETLKLELEQTELRHTSRDVLAVVPGTQFPREAVVLTAHYDSLRVGPGAWDNATGAATLLYIYDHFLRNPPKRTMRFIWCGSEEQGLLGSKAFIAQNETLLDPIRMCFNFDMCGTILGQNHIFVTGSEELKTAVTLFCSEAGYPAKLDSKVHSSDSAPFADHGIPGVGLSRDTGSGEIHTRYDCIDILSPVKLKENGDFAVWFIRRFTDSQVFPVKKEIPEDVKKELDKYFKRIPRNA